MSRKRALSRRTTQRPSGEQPARQLADVVASPDERFLHRKHAVTLLWSVAAGVIGSALTIAYQAYQPPPTVVIANRDTVPRVIVVHDSAASRGFETLIAEVRAMRRASSRNPNQAVAGLRPSSEPAAVPTPINDLQVQRWQFHKGVEGYTQGSLAGIARTYCSARQTRPGAEIEAGFTFRSDRTVEQVTPIFVDLSRRHTPTSRTLILSQQFTVQKANRILVQAPSDTGQFILTLGVYFRSDSTAAYPERLALECPIEVRAGAV